MSELGDALVRLEVSLLELSAGLDETKRSLVEWQASMLRLREALRSATAYREVGLYNEN